MKKKVVMLLTACMLASGCGIDTGSDTRGETDDAVVEESDEETDDASREMSAEDNLDESSSKSDDETDAASEASIPEEEKEKVEAVKDASDMELFNRFLGIEGESLNAVSDVDILAEYDGTQYLEFKTGDVISASKIKEDIKKSGEDMGAGYTFFYEDTDSPVLVIRVPGIPENPDKNNLLMFFKVQDGIVHLVNYKNTLDDKYIDSYVVNEGLASYNFFTLGKSGSYIRCNETYIVDEDAQMLLIYTKTTFSVTEAEYLSDEDEVFVLFTQTYSEDSSSYISQIECDNETYYVLDSNDTDLDKEFIDSCEKKGIKINEWYDVVEVIDDYIDELGFDACMSNLDAGRAEFEEF